MTKTLGALKVCLVAASMAMTGSAAAQTGAADGAAPECEERMAEVRRLIREKDMEIPSSALNDIFTLQQQATEACSGRSDALALTILDDLETTVLDAVAEGIPRVTAEDADAAFQEEIGQEEIGVTGSTITESMSDPDRPGDDETAGDTADDTADDTAAPSADDNGFVREPGSWEPPEDLQTEIEEELGSDPVTGN